MKYDFDSYLLYEVTPSSLYTAKVVVELSIPVNGDVLRSAAQKAFRRFPYFSRTVRTDENGAYVLEPCEEPICVFEEGDPVVLGTARTNGLLFAVTYSENTVYFNLCHNFCGGSGAMPWIKLTLWQYLTDEGYPIDPDGILDPGSPITPEETAVPDPGTFPEEEVIGHYTGGNSYFPMLDYIPYLAVPSKSGQVYYPITIDKSHLMKYARENDGSPNSILSALMFRMCSRVFPDAKQISCGIVCNYRKDVGCPETYRDLVRILHARYLPKMKDWPIDKLSTVTRGCMYLQMQPELSRETYRHVAAYREKIDSISGKIRKTAYALKNSPLRSGDRDTFNISYVGNVDLGGLSEYIIEIYSLTEGHLMLEVNSLRDIFCITFQVLNRDERFVREFAKVLTEEGIPYELGETRESRLPQIEIGK